MASSSSVTMFNYSPAAVPIFEGENYEFWSTQMRTFFISQDLWDLVQNGSERLQSQADYATWPEARKKKKLKECEMKDAKALYYIQLAINKTIAPKIIAATKSKEAWEILKNEFQGLEKMENKWKQRNVSNHISENLARLASIPVERCIFRVHDRLREVNPNAYEPEVVAIGPYHHGKDNLKPMEEHKLHYLNELIRRKETNVLRYVEFMQESEEEARKFYADPINLDSNKFVEMMLLDSCFIIELLRKSANIIQWDNNDLIWQFPHILSGIRRDLMLVENQLPFFILLKFFNMTKISNPNEEKIINMSIDFFRRVQCFTPEKDLPIEDVIRDDEEILQRQTHLLGLVHYCWSYPIRCFPMVENAGYDEGIVEQSSRKRRFCLARKFCNNRAPESQEPVWHINCATELQKAGIKFKKAKAGTSSVIKFVIGTMEIRLLRVSFPSRNIKYFKKLITWIKFLKAEERTRTLFDVDFDNGTMEIPALRVSGETEPIFRNLIAHELRLPNFYTKCFTDYAIFMDYLVSTPEDVEILRHHGIIDKFVGDHELVCSMLNGLGDNAKRSNYYYLDVFSKVNENCRKPWNKAKVSLRTEYFNSPWAFLSFLAAVVLLLLTATQTVFSVLSFVKQQW